MQTVLSEITIKEKDILTVIENLLAERSDAFAHSICNGFENKKQANHNDALILLTIISCYVKEGAKKLE